MTQKTILVIGSTGNTGVAATKHLAELAHGYRILALTRDDKSAVAQDLASVENVTIEEYDWSLIDEIWLNSRNVEKAYIAPANSRTQYTDEMRFYVAAKDAGVKYVVRVSTTEYAIRPASPIYYGRTVSSFSTARF